LLNEAGAQPQLLIREKCGAVEHPFSTKCEPATTAALAHFGSRRGMESVAAHHFPTAAHRLPAAWMTHFLKGYLPPEGAWWLRSRIEDLVPIHLSTSVAEARHDAKGRVALRLLVRGMERYITVDHVVAGTGYNIDVERIAFLDAQLRGSLDRNAGGPTLNSRFESSVAGLHFIGPLSQRSFGPLFRFVVGADYTAKPYQRTSLSRAPERLFIKSVI
jgi:FAD-dependent urate hydroxylase